MRKAHVSLEEVHESVDLLQDVRWWRRWFAVAGPAIMVAVGYMDPGNWATDLAAGSRYNYALIWVLLMSNLMAVLLHSMAVRLGIVSRRDLAQACREEYPPLVNIPLYILAEIAITATDLAEVLGSAIALQLLFGIPLLYGVLITAFDTLLLLFLSHYGIRKLEAVVASLVGTIGLALLVEIFLARPDWPDIASGFVPSIPDTTALYIAIGMLGATVMPHNLYLHSALVQTRRVKRDKASLRDAIRWNTIDSAVALSLAFFVNSAILVMAAAVFYRNGLREVAEIQEAYRLLEPLLGTTLAPLAFGIGLLASGQSSTITGTLAGQVVMEGYLNLRIRPWLRRLITRLLAITPALIAISLFGEHATSDLLVLSQVILSLQLPFAVIPLIHMVSDRERMGEFALGRRMQGVAWTVAGVIVALNVRLLVDEVSAWMAAAGPEAWWVRALVFPAAAALAALLVYITVRPWLDPYLGRAGVSSWTPVHREAPVPSQVTPPTPYRRIVVALDFGGGEERLLREVVRVAGGSRPHVYLIHVVESPAARAVGPQAADSEVARDEARLQGYARLLREQGFEVTCLLGMGHPVPEIARLVNETAADLLIMGSHGHAGLADVVHGTTIEGVRHRVRANVLIVNLGEKEAAESAWAASPSA